MKMKEYSVFIELRDHKQVHWWNIVSLFVKVVDRIDVIDDVTNKTVGYIFKITGLFAKYIASKSVSLFIEDPVEI